MDDDPYSPTFNESRAALAPLKFGSALDDVITSGACVTGALACDPDAARPRPMRVNEAF